MTLFAMSDDGQLILGIVSSVFGFLTAVATGIIGVYMVKANTKAKEAAAEVKEVKGTAAAADRKADIVASTLLQTTVTNAETAEKQSAQLEEIAKTGKAVHVLVNSAMSQQLHIAAVALRRVAELTKHPDDIEAARLAEESFREHELKQHALDHMNGTNKPDKSPEGNTP